MHTYRFELASDRPVLSLAPLCTRMVAAYEDRTGTVHLFTDAYDPRRETAFEDPLDSWEAQTRYLSTTDLETWEDHGFVLTRGKWCGDVARSDADRAAVGAALGLNLSAVVPAPLRAGNPPTFVFAFFGNFQKVDPTKVTAASHFQNDLGLDSLDAV